MYVKEIYIQKFRHLENVSLGSDILDIGQGSDFVVLAGPNGGGKSSILELISFALSNSWSLNWSLSRSFPTYAFEVAIALSTADKIQIQEHYEKLDPAQKNREQVKSAFEYIIKHSEYYRAYNYDGGKYQENSSLFNQVHSLVANAIKTDNQRSLGFFLKSDRAYPQKKFSQNRIFSFSQIMKIDHLWSMAYNTSNDQYNDMYEFLVQQRYHYLRRLGSFYHKNNTNQKTNKERPEDPLEPYDKLLQQIFPNYRFADIDEDVPSDLFIELPSSDVIPFSDLSSGEKEVFFILSFFLRHDVSNAVIVIDEPELHLHPELARRLIRVMLEIKQNNQIWFATHNPEIIDEAGREKIIYVEKDPTTFKSRISYGIDETEEIIQLKKIFGYSGYIGITRNVVFLEGELNSTDKKIFSNLFPDYSSQLKFVPVGGSDNLLKINNAVLELLENNLGSMNYYLIRDRDFLTDEIVAKYHSYSSGRIYVLERYHIENYLLEEVTIAKIQSEIYNIQIAPDQVRNTFLRISRKIAGEVLRDMVSFRLNLMYSPQDFSIGNFLKGQTILDTDENWDENDLNNYKKYLIEKVNETNSALIKQTSGVSLENLVSNCQMEIKNSIFDGNEGWKYLFPGRRLIEEYVKDQKLGKAVIFQNTIIKEYKTNPTKIPSEIKGIMLKIVNEEKLN